MELLVDGIINVIKYLFIELLIIDISVALVSAVIELPTIVLIYDLNFRVC